MAGTRTSGIIWISVVLMAASITTSTLGLFMDSWRTFDAVNEENEKIDGLEGRTGLKQLLQNMISRNLLMDCLKMNATASLSRMWMNLE